MTAPFQDKKLHKNHPELNCEIKWSNLTVTYGILNACGINKIDHPQSVRRYVKCPWFVVNCPLSHNVALNRTVINNTFHNCYGLFGCERHPVVSRKLKTAALMIHWMYPKEGTPYVS